MLQKIVIDIRPGSPFHLQDHYSRCKNLLQYWIEHHRDYHFIVLDNNEFVSVAFANEALTIIPQPAKGFKSLLAGISLLRVLKREKPDIFLSFNGLLPKPGNRSQFVFINDAGFLDKKNGWPAKEAGRQKRKLSRINTRTTLVFTDSQLAKDRLISAFKIKKEKIKLVSPAATEPETGNDSIQPHKPGKPYFLYSGMIHPAYNLLTLCKAFSFFKKRQRSDWKLVIAGEAIKGANKFLDKLAHYKYKEDLQVMTNGEEQSIKELEKNAYARIFPSLLDYNTTAVIKSLIDEVPVIAAHNSVAAATAGKAALLANADDYNDMADKMMLLYKDENLHRQLAEKGKETAASLTWQRMADELWTAMTGLREQH